MLMAALANGTAERQVTFEVFARRLPAERRYGIVAGTARVLEAIRNFRFHDEQLEGLDFLDETTLNYLRNYRFTGDVDGYREGELYFPSSPILSVRGTFAECVILETVILSIMNADSAVASAATRMVCAADGRPIMEMGSRRTQEYAAVSAARAAYIAGFDATSNLEAAHRYGIPASGTAAHAWTLLHVGDNGHPDEKAAFAAQIEKLGVETTLLVDTFDITQGVANAIEVAGPKLGAVRIDSGDLGAVTRRVRKQLDELGARETKIVVSSDLDEFAIAGLRGDPVDVYGVGTSVVTGSGAPTASLVYKMVEVEGYPVSKRASGKITDGGSKAALRTYRTTGVGIEELIYPLGATPPEHRCADQRILTVPLLRGGEDVGSVGNLDEARALVRLGIHTLPWEGLALGRGEPAVPTRLVGF